MGFGADHGGAGVDPWDETPVAFPRGLLSVLLDAADLADEAGLLGGCPTNPCPTCTALQDAHEALRPADD